MKKNLLILALVAFSVVFSFESVEAKSQTWQSSPTPYLQTAQTDTICVRNCDNFDMDRWEYVYDKAIPLGALTPSTVNVLYASSVRNNTTGQVFDDGAVSVGDSISFVPKAVQNTDISWVGTGYWGDSPYGFWGTGRAACSPEYYTNTEQVSTASVENHFALYVQPSGQPTISRSGTAGLSCDASGFNCTVTSPGTISATITWPEASGKFSYAGNKRGVATPLSADWHNQGCNTGSGYLYDSQRAANSGCSFDIDADQQHCLLSNNQPQFSVNVPAISITHAVSAASGNSAPNAPTITGPTTGAVNTSHNFTFQATDPNNDTLKYGIDWDNNGSIDQWMPGSGYVASNTSQSSNYSWSVTGSKTFQALAQDSNGANSGWSTHTISLDSGGGSCILGPSTRVNFDAPGGSQNPCTVQAVEDRIGVSFSSCTAGATTGMSSGGACLISHGGQQIPAQGVYEWACEADYYPCNNSGLTVNLTINGSDGPLSVTRNSALNLSWASAGASSCTAWGAGWGAGGSISVNGTASTTANQSDTYILQCTNGTTTVTDSVQVSLASSLKICQNSCNSGVMRGEVGGTGSFTLARNGQQNLVACFNSAAGCSDSSGDVTTGASWSEGGSNVISLSGTQPKVVTGDNSGTESVSVNYSSQTASSNVTVTCIPTVSCENASQSSNTCENETFTVDNGCGIAITCNGTKTCNYNWKEVAP